jgi:hypothetical protein
MPRKDNSAFWREWCGQMQRDLASNLADTIGEKPSKDDAIYEAVNKLIDVEQTLSAILGR